MRHYKWILYYIDTFYLNTWGPGTAYTYEYPYIHVSVKSSLHEIALCLAGTNLSPELMIATCHFFLIWEIVPCEFLDFWYLVSVRVPNNNWNQKAGRPRWVKCWKLWQKPAWSLSYKNCVTYFTWWPPPSIIGTTPTLPPPPLPINGFESSASTPTGDGLDTPEHRSRFMYAIYNI